MRHTGTMSALDLLWWLPVTAGLSALAVVAAWRAGRRRDLRATTGRLGWALAPWAVLLLGLYGLAGRVAAAAALWAGRFVLDPVAWLGLVTAVVAVGLIAVGRGGRSKDTEPEPPALTARRAGGDDMADVEAILRKHGIT